MPDDFYEGDGDDPDNDWDREDERRADDDESYDPWGDENGYEGKADAVRPE